MWMTSIAKHLGFVSSESGCVLAAQTPRDLSAVSQMRVDCSGAGSLALTNFLVFLTVVYLYVLY